MLLDELHQKKTAIEGLARQYGAHNIRVFGSVARGQERPDSDVDFLAELPVGYDLFTQRMPLAEKLSVLLQRKVDLIPEHELNRYLRKHIISEAESL
ncbi:MAG TPA: nucleotidyltransferase domain-containing protein [Cellvibrionaceae bacterium]